MIPGMGGRGGVNPKQLQKMMRQMGIEMEDIAGVEEVVIRTVDREIVIKPAEVQKITQAGQSSWQVVGTVKERARSSAPPAPVTYTGAPTATAKAPAAGAPKFTEEDVALVAEQAGVSREKARNALEECDGEPAEAIVKLTGG